MAPRETPCRICGSGSGREVHVTVNIGGAARVWLIRCCRDCWRVFETQLDSGSLAMQRSFDVPGVRGSNAFWLW